jgi:hypothetical protein
MLTTAITAAVSVMMGRVSGRVAHAAMVAGMRTGAARRIGTAAGLLWVLILGLLA